MEKLFHYKNPIIPGFHPDPSICRAEDYFMSNHNEEDGTASIIQCSIDPLSGKKLTEGHCIWKGCGGRYLEGPHLYKIGSWYYLMGAEGGTEYGHMEVLSRGVSPYGPFQNAPGNPIVTNRDLGDYPLQGTGHGDLVEDPFGNQWMVLLAFRQTGPYLPFHHLGRETCLIPVHFTEDGWLEAGTDGKVLLDIKTSRPLECSRQTGISSLTFRNTKPGNEWVWLCNPSRPDYDFSRWESEDPIFRLKGNGYTLSTHGVSPSFLGLRQQEMEGIVQVQVRLSHKGEAGITLYMDYQHHYDFGLKRTASSLTVIKRRTVGDMTYIQQSETLDPGIKEAVLSVAMTAENYFFTLSAGSRKLSFGQAKTRYLSSEVAGGFTGVIIGLYAFDTDEWAEFSCFEYQPVRSKDF